MVLQWFALQLRLQWRLRCNTNAYVVKPVDFHEFVNAIKELGVFWAVINQPPPGSIRKR